ncbi:unnamed protein product [Boreogadus saida]
MPSSLGRGSQEEELLSRGVADGRDYNHIRKYLSQHQQKLPWSPEGEHSSDSAALGTLTPPRSRLSGVWPREAGQSVMTSPAGGSGVGRAAGNGLPLISVMGELAST